MLKNINSQCEKEYENFLRYILLNLQFSFLRLTNKTGSTKSDNKIMLDLCLCHW